MLTRRNAALFTLALGGFSLGLTEFVTIGLLPEIAHSLMPALDHRAPGRALSHAGWSVSAYALGVVVGAPTMAVLTAHISKLKVLAGLLIALVVGNLASALAPNLALLLVARFVAGMPHGAYFSVAGLLAANALGPGARARGFALVLAGLTFANVVGVPVITRLGQLTSWRVAYAAVAAVFLTALVLASVLVEDVDGDAASVSSPRDELGALRSPGVWIAFVITAIGLGGFFTVDSYLSPVTIHSAHLSASTVPWVLAVVGLGMTVGIIAGGASADRHPTASLLGGLGALVLSMIAFALTASHPIALFVCAFCVGATALFIAPAVQARLLHEAPKAVMIGAALFQSAANVGNSIGALAGGAVVTSGLSYTATGWAGAAFAGFGLACFAVLLRVGSRGRPLTHT